MFQFALYDPAVDSVEVLFRDEEREVLRLDLDSGLGEQYAPVVVELDDAEGPPGCRFLAIAQARETMPTRACPRRRLWRGSA